MERVVLFLLSQVIFGILERPLGEDLYFSAYSMWEHGKILWQNGEAVGFYTVKKKGNFLQNSFSSMLRNLVQIFFKKWFDYYFCVVFSQAACVTAALVRVISSLCWTLCLFALTGEGPDLLYRCWRISAHPSPLRAFWELAFLCLPACMEVCIQ